jgi:hypothetical protein
MKNQTSVPEVDDTQPSVSHVSSDMTVQIPPLSRVSHFREVPLRGINIETNSQYARGDELFRKP